MRLLFVEDDLRLVSFVVKGLKEAGFVVVHVADGQSGLQMALDGSYDAAVIDIMLPGMDGLALIEELRLIAKQNHCGRIEWMVARDNKNGIEFYEKLGATILEEVRHARFEQGVIDQ